MKVEVQDDKNGFRFRLTHGKRHTAWVGYRSIVMLGNTAAATAYYVGEANHIKPMPAADLLRIIAAGEVKE